jgi:hypothetical protein
LQRQTNKTRTLLFSFLPFFRQVLHCRSVIAAAEQIATRRGIEAAEAATELAGVRKEAQEKAAAMR